MKKLKKKNAEGVCLLDLLTQLAHYAQQNWLLIALVAMFCASLANLTLKILVKNQGLLKLDWGALVPVVVLVVIAAVAGWFLFVKSSDFALTNAQWFWIAALAAFALGTFVFTTLALQTGKVALVTAVLSLSTVLVAVLSVVFLGDKFTPKQMAALVFAVISVLMLVL